MNPITHLTTLKKIEDVIYFKGKTLDMLHDAGILTISELINTTKDELLNLPGCTEKMVEEIEYCLNKRGLRSSNV